MSPPKSSSLSQLTEPKGFASLTGSLLARKGQAKPAMRPQLYSFASPADDLGWNDLGLDIAPAENNSVQRAQDEIADAFTAREPEPEVVQEEPVLARSVDDIASLLPGRRAAPGSKGKAAFTLRLAGDRHLRLRLACALQHRSAQQVVTDALDRYLLTLPEVEAAMRRECPAGHCAREAR